MTVKVQGGILNLRENPTTSSRILAKIPDNTELNCLKKETDWSQVEYKGTTGWVKNDFITIITSISKEDLQKIYNSLKSSLQVIENILNK